MAVNKSSIYDEIYQETDINRLLEIVDKVDREVRDIVLDKIETELNREKKEQAFREIRGVISEVDEPLEEWVKYAVGTAFCVGINDMSHKIKGNTILYHEGKRIADRVTIDTLRNVDELSDFKNLADSLVSDAYMDFANGMNGVYRGAEHKINDALKRQMKKKTIMGELTGKAMRDVAKDVEQVLGDRGFSVLLDRGGREWSLKHYSEMLARTHVMKSANDGAIARAGHADVDILEVSSHSDPCEPICVDLEGNIYSISGESDNYPELDLELPAHPNCRHTWIPRPDLE